MSDRRTQKEKLRAFLEGHRGDWVPLPWILKLGIAQYNARIFELRADGEREGFVIDNATKRDEETGETHSFYRFRYTPRAKQQTLFQDVA